MITGLFATALTFAPGALTVRVEGEGYLRFLREGRAVFARQADLVVEKGELREKSGPGFLPPIRVGSAAEVSIAPDGTVTARPNHTFAGRLYLARFTAGAAFEPSGAFVLARDRAELGYPQQPGFGAISCGGGRVEKPMSSVTNPPVREPVRVVRDPAPESHPPAKSSAAGTVTIRVPATVEVEGAQITLGDIAQIQGAEADVARLKALDLGNAPMHGIPMRYARERLFGKVTYLGFDRRAVELDMPPTVEIRRKGQTVTADQIVAAAKKAVEEKLGLSGDLSPMDPVGEIQGPIGDLEIVAENVRQSDGVATVQIAVRIDGKRFFGRAIRLTGSCLETAVALGAPVSVRFVSNGLIVEMPGKAKSAGAIGQTIEVAVTLPENRETTLHQGTIVAAGVVEVRA